MRSGRFYRVLAGVSLVAALSIGPARAQVIVPNPRNDTPVITRIMPLGLRLGETAEITITGQRLGGLSGVLCSGGVELAEVVEATDKQAVLRLRSASDAAPGARAFHVLCEAGLSNPRLLRLDNLPQSVESEANDSHDRATPLSAPCAVSGTLTKTDRDFYRFEASRGQRLVFDLEAWRVGSALEPCLSLYDARGREIAATVTATPDIAPDARLSHTFAEAGVYYLAVRDRTYQGADFCCYYLRVGEPWYATRSFPLGGQRGQQVDVTLEGGSLPKPLTQRVDLSAAPAGRQAPLAIRTPRGVLQTPNLFHVGELPEITESEPNNKPEQAQAITAPVTINGRIDGPRDRDCFRFRATAGEKRTIRVLAQRLGSRLDAFVQVLDAGGKALATADDSPLNDRLPPVARPAQPAQTEPDAILEFAAPKTGEYVVTLDDRYLFGGRDFAYRLQISESQPDFDLIVQPGEASDPKQKGRRARQGQQVLAEFAGQGTGALSLDRGGRGTVVVLAARRGYDGPVRLRVDGLPPGVFAAEAVLAPGQTQGTIVFRSDFDAQSVASFVRIVGEAEIAGRTLERAARQPVIFTGVGNVIAQHELDMLAVGVSARGAELALRGELMAAMIQGGKSQLRVMARKREGVQGPVTVRATNLPSGVDAKPITLNEKQQTGTLDLAVDLGVIPGKRVIELEGSLSVKGRKEPLLATAEVEIEIQPAVSWEFQSQQVEVSRGGRTTVLLNVRRLGGPTEAIELTTSRLPSGVSIESLSVPRDAETFSLVFLASEGASASPLRRIVQIKGVTRVGERKMELPTLRLALKVTRPARGASE